MDLELADKVALITGGTSGIGLAIARRMLEERAKVFICGRDEAKLAQALDDLRPLGEAHGATAHVDQPSDMPGLVASVVKKLGRIPEGGGWRMRGRGAGPHGGGQGYDYLHVAVDDCSRFAVVGVYPDERGETAAAFLRHAVAVFAARGVRVERVMTDRAFAYTRSHAFQAALDELGARHVVTRPYRPQTNGKVERFNRTLNQEWAYAQTYLTDEARAATYQAWIHHYNHHRPHTGIKGNSPIERLDVHNLPAKNS